ncbi:MAG: C-4 sterol methyl oxidase [Pycnora praestabilis]|nr:MAG: C-4 sterol methyl oxidase [Pycnora praestabilis]
MNVTTHLFDAAPSTFSGIFEEISQNHIHLNALEKLWVAWYAYMQNDVLATGIVFFIMHEVFYFGRSLPWMIIDHIPYFNKYKIQDAKVPSDAEQWACTKLVLITHFTIEMPTIGLFHPIMHFVGLSTGIPFPSLLTMAYQIPFFLFFEDAWHYWCHRALHWGPLYKAIHKTHHKFSAPFGMAASYASPVEIVVLGLGTILPPIIWSATLGNMHILTVYVWVILRLFQAIDAHSGYDFPWSFHHWFPMWAGADWHDSHHETFKGNYSSSFRWWDYAMGTVSKIAPSQNKKAMKAKAI